MARQILASRLEHAPPKAAALALRGQIKLEDFAAVTERRHAIAPIADIADDRIAEFQHQKRRPARDREAPPGGPLRAIMRSSSRPGMTPR